jgi:uncharacterized coiled-coil protein SlyX
MAVVMLPRYIRGIPDDTSIMILAAGCALFSVVVCIVSMLFGSIAAAVVTFIAVFSSVLYGLMYLSSLALRVENMELREQLLAKWEHRLQYEKERSGNQEATIKVRDDELKERDATVKKLTESIRFLDKQLQDIHDMVLCPIALAVPHDPVITSTGIMYSRGCFQRYNKKMGKVTCPLTFLPVKYVYEVRVIWQICQKFIELTKDGEKEWI